MLFRRKFLYFLSVSVFMLAINVPPDQRKQHILWVKKRRVNSVELGQAFLHNARNKNKVEKNPF